MTTLRRRVHCYSIAAYQEEDGDLEEIGLADVFAVVRSLKPQREEPSRYMPISAGNELMMEIVETPGSGTKGSIRGRFGIKRRTGLPPVEEAGNYSILQLAAEAGLAELRHFVVDPSRKLLGIEVNGNAPGISRWAGYLMDRVPDAFFVRTEVILSGDAGAALKRIGIIRGASLTVFSDRVEQLGSLDEGLRKGMKELKKSADNAREITVSFEIGTRKRDAGLDLRWRDKLKTFLSKDENLQALDDVTLRAFDKAIGRTHNIDLLEDRFVGHVTAATLDESGRVIDSESMFAEIGKILAAVPPGV